MSAMFKAVDQNALDRPINITIWKNAAAAEKSEGLVSLRKFARKIATRSAPTKEQLWWLKLAKFGDRATEKKSLRNNENVLSIDGLEADYDAGEMAVSQAVEIAEKAGLACLIYTSPSHTPEFPKWRVLAPFSETLEPADRDHMMGRLNGLFNGAFAAESWTLSQSYFYGCVDGSKSTHCVELVEGQAIDELDELDEIWRPKPTRIVERFESGGVSTYERYANSSPLNVQAAVDGIVISRQYHNNMFALMAHAVGKGATREEAVQFVRNVLEQIPLEERDTKWRLRHSDRHINPMIEWILMKENRKFFTSIFREAEREATRRASLVEFEAVEGKPQAPDGLFEFLDMKAIKTLPDPKWLIDGLAIENALGFVYGPPGCLKTFICLDMALSFCVGMPDWWGRTIEKAGAVIYISQEGQSDLKFRVEAWEQKNGVFTDEAPFYLIRQTINFMRPEDIGKLLATVKFIADRCQVPIAAVFVDTVSRVLPGADENVQKDMTLFVAACDAVREQFGTIVVGVHHTSRNGNMRGSTVFPGAGDFIVEVEREPGATTGLIRAVKIKAAQDGWEQSFKVEERMVGVTRTSLTVAPTEAAPKNNPKWPDHMTLRRIKNAINEAWLSGRPWSPKRQAKATGAYAVANIVRDFEVKEKIAEDIIEQWQKNGVVSFELSDAKTKKMGLKVLVFD